jgi:hypothetical protein
MSAKAAAAALLRNDVDLASFARQWRAGWQQGKSEAVEQYIRQHVMNTWTLTLAAQSAGVTEEQVIAALLYINPLRTGSTCVCRGRAASMFS